MKKALILLSGGVDSTVLLAKALEEGLKCITLGFHYGQNHALELEAAEKIARFYHVPFTVIKIDPLLFNNSSLLSSCSKKESSNGTVVMGRNLVFLSHSLAFGSGYSVEEIHIGVNEADHAVYADCRPAFIDSAQKVFETTYADTLKECPVLKTPLLFFNKEKIGEEGRRLNAPLELTWSCYFPTKENKPCKECSACLLRKKALNLF